VSPRFVIVCGSGGVGKTTASAAIGVRAARSGERVLVVTVDPARRLAQALGLDEIGHDMVEVDVGGSGRLEVAMLDTKANWDALIRRHARDGATAERVLRNPLYHNITSRFVNSHDYIAMEQVHALSTSDDHDLVVIDTPPSRNALDLLDAPRKMREFFGGRLVQWLTLPYKSRVLTFASRPFLQIADRLLGATFLGDVSEFFALLQTMERGFIARATEVERLLTSPTVASVIVASGEPESAAEAGHLAAELVRRRMALSGVIVNRVVNARGVDLPDLATVRLHATSVSPDDAEAALAEVAQIIDRDVRTADRHRAGLDSLSSLGVPVSTVAEAEPGADPTGILEAMVAAASPS
jgi:anion-transporting  ArsA/GET3 family ATPase